MKKDIKQLDEAIRNLPALPQRPGLKQEMLANILAEVRRELPTEPKRRFAWKRPAIGYALSFGGLAVAVALLCLVLPLQSQKRQSAEPPTLRTGAYSVDSNKKLDEELAQLKAQREKELLGQVIPRKNGQYIGEGMFITLQLNDPDEARKSYLFDDVESDYDLLKLVQEIYDNGGQLVSINGILVKPYTQIVSHGVLTAVRDRRIQAPFLIKVIGDQEALDNALRSDHSALKNLQKEKNLSVQIDDYQFVTIDSMS